MVLQKTCHSIGAKTFASAKVIGHREVDHRAANSSQLVSGHLGLHERQSPSPESRDALAAAVDRIFSVAGVRRRICRLEPQDPVNVSSYRPDSDAAPEEGCADDAQRLPATGGWARSF
jgi:two-component sensor histidine kinase